MKYCYQMDQLAYDMSKKASLKFSDLENPWTAFKSIQT